MIHIPSIIPLLTHTTTFIQRPSSYDSSGSPVFIPQNTSSSFNTTIPTPCFFQSYQRQLQQEDGAITKTRARFFFGPDIEDFPIQTKILFADITYEVLDSLKFFDTRGNLHHYEIIVR